MNSTICRLCAVEKEVYTDICSENGTSSIGQKINKYLNFRVDENDILPKSICWDCYNYLELYSAFVEKTHDAQLIIMNMFSCYDDTCMKEELLFNEITYESDSFTPPPLLYQNEFGKNVCHSVSGNADECRSMNTREPNNYAKQYLPGKTSEDNMGKNSVRINNKNATYAGLRKKNLSSDRYYSTNSVVEKARRRLHRRNNLPTKKNFNKSNGRIYHEDFDQNQSEVFKQKYFNNIAWLCARCEHCFETLVELQHHQARSHLETGRYMCPYCYKVYCHYRGFVRHIKTHKNIKGVDNTGDNSTFLNNEKSALDRQPYRCSDCGKTFKKTYALRLHLRCHLPAYMKYNHVCNICGKRLTRKQNLKIHKRIHENAKNYICDHCGKSFAQKGSLDAHITVHKEERTFQCNFCDLKFKSAIRVQKHSMLHKNEKSYQCDICGKTFRESGTLKDHSRIHTGDKPYSCEYCGKSFRFRGILATHRRVHTGERPYSCTECVRTFTNWSNCNKHLMRRHGTNASGNIAVKQDARNLVYDRNASTEDTLPINVEHIKEIDIPCFEENLQATRSNENATY